MKLVCPVTNLFMTENILTTNINSLSPDNILLVISKEERDKIKRQEYQKQWYLKNKDKCKVRYKDYNKQYAFKNKDKIRTYQKTWNFKNEDKIKIQRNNYYLKNEDKIKIQNQNYYKSNKDKIIKKQKIYYNNNKPACLKYAKKYEQENKDKINLGIQNDIVRIRGVRRARYYRNYDKNIKYAKKYNQKNREKISKKCKERWRNDPEFKKAAQSRGKKHYDKNREKILKRIKQNRIKNKEKRRIKNYKWCQENKPKLIDRYIPEYTHWRTAVYERDNHICQDCGKNHCKVYAHHINPFLKFPELRFELSNGKTLCHDCHVIADRENRKLYYSELEKQPQHSITQPTPCTSSQTI